MRTLLVLSLVLPLVAPVQNGSVTDDGSSMAVLGHKWTRSRQIIERLNDNTVMPAAAQTRADKNFERNKRVNDPAGVREPNADSMDTRSAALEKSVREARAPERKAVDGFAYRVKVRNAAAKAVEVVFWEYQFKESANPLNVARRQFLCGVQIKPGKEKEIQAFGVSGPSDVISISSLAEKSGGMFEERVVINRVEYADGTIWQRKDWNFAEVRLSIARAVGTPWGAEMCRGL